MPTTKDLGDSPRRSLFVAGLATLFLIYFLREFTDYLAGNVKYLAMVLLSLLLMLVLGCLCFEAATLRVLRALYQDRERVARRAYILIMVGLASLTHFNSVLLSHGMYVQARIVTLPISMPNTVVWAIMTCAALVLLIRVPRTYAPIHMLALIWGVVLRVMVLRAVPFNPEAADMLYCIDRTCDTVLRGLNPYSGQTCEVSPSHSLPLAYFPLLWLPYLPFKALSFDIRWFNMLAQLGLYLFFLKLIGPKTRSASRSLLFLFLVLMPDMIWTFFYRQVSHYWLLGAVYIWLMSRERWNQSLLAVSGLVLMRVTALTTLWVYLLYVWKKERALHRCRAHGFCRCHSRAVFPAL